MSSQELFDAQQRSPDGVIQFSQEDFDRFVVAKSRPYSLVFLLVAEKLMDRPKLGLRPLRKEFGLASQAYKQKYGSGSERAGKVFFVTVELDATRDVFRRLNVDTLPYAFRLAPHATIGTTGMIEIPPEERMSFQRYPDYPWKAEAFAEFVKIRTGVAVDEIPRSDFLSSRLSALFMFVFLASSIWTASRLYQSAILRSRWIWMIGAVIVCWFSTSGGMFNIIRGVPFAMPKDGKIQLFYRGNGQQLGAEGFMMGTLYVLFSASILGMTYGPERVANPSARRFTMLVTLVLAALFLRQVVFFYAMKTGYPIQQYLY